MKIILFALIALSCTYAHAQVVTVVDKTTGEPLPGIVIQAKNKPAVVTDAEGKADLATFAGADSISFIYSNYYTSIISFAQLQKNGYKFEVEAADIDLLEVMISTGPVEKKIIEKPNRVEKLDMKEVAFQNPQTTADLLATSGYVYIQKSQLGGGSPMLRGMATNRVLLVIDGVRMNNATFRSGNLQNVISLDANAMEATEIFFGPGAVKYGSDALGGVMNFTTRKAKLADTSAGKNRVDGNALIRTSTANSEKTGHLDFNVRLKKWAFVTSVTRSEYSDLRSGSVGGVNSFYRSYYVQTVDSIDYMTKNDDSTLQVGSRYSQNNFMQKIRFSPTKSWDLEYDFHFSETSPYNRYDRLYVMRTSGPNRNKLRFAEWYYGPQKWNMHRVGISHSKRTLLFDRVNLISALQNFEESRFDREFLARQLRMQKETVSALSFNLDLEKRVSKKIFVSYGAEYVHNRVRSFANLSNTVTKKEEPTVTRYPDGSTWESRGAYLSLKYLLTRKLIINGGLRYSYYKIKADFDTTFFPFPFTDTEMKNGTTNGSIGFVFAAQTDWQIYLNAATGFRAPNIDDMGKVFESTPGFLVVPNPALKPEHAYNAELGTVKRFGKTLELDLAGFYTLLENGMERKDYQFNGQSLITYQGTTSRVQAIQNVTQIRVYGVQAGFEFNYLGFGLRSTFSYQYGEEQTPDSLIYYPLRHAAPLFGTAHLTYEYKKLKFDFYTIYNGKKEYEELALTERINPSYARDYSTNPAGLPYSDSWYTLNFKAAFYAKRFFTVMAGVENIADILYRPYSSGINAPGRNFILSLHCKF